MTKKTIFQRALLTYILFLSIFTLALGANNYPIVDTDQTKCYDANGQIISAPSAGSSLYGQDAQYTGNVPSYTNNGDGTITDNVTGLMWQRDPGSKMTYAQAVAAADSFNLAGYTDWRLPSIKELYSLIRFSGTDPSGPNSDSMIPFINSDYFVFTYGDESQGERVIDSQYVSSTKYVNTTMNGNETVFGVNFADGRIKGYPTQKTFYVLYVRGTSSYGINDFVNNGDGTITDNATGLMWSQNDSGHLGAANGGALNWEEALEWAENFSYAGYSDWRLPNAKELQSIVDYTRSPATTNSAAIDPLFNSTSITDEGGSKNYPFYWTSTTHANARSTSSGINSAYVCFGEALGWMQFGGGGYQLMDVHGAGAQRSDSKQGDPSEYPYGHGPQGDVVRIYHYVRLVRTATNTTPAPTTYTLTVNSSDSGAAITVSPADNSSNGSGTAPFTRTYDSGTTVTLTAPATHNGKTFSKWNVGGSETTGTSTQVTISSNKTATAYYESDNGGGGGGGNGSGTLSVNKERLNFGMIPGLNSSQSQQLFVGNSGDTVTWSAGSDVSWLNLSRTSATGSSTITVSVNGSGLSTGTYYGHITISSSQANTLSVLVSLKVFQSGNPPFGNYATPSDYATVSSSVAFTGWALDDVGISSVKLYREQNGALLYIGDASLVEGARPDVEASYPDYPNCSAAGWGYMMLTNFLPNSGNGTFTIHAIATDVEGRQTSLGTRTIIVDNANAEKPFGAIDTPSQGGTASGGQFVCWGWALTPRPAYIAADGSTIDVWVDGVNLGHPTYNVYRSDIAGLFAGYANSNGAIGYFVLDTTGYEDGVHTIQWTVRDSNGKSDGIGSRYFTIQNGNARQSSQNRFAQASAPFTAKTGTFLNSGKLKARNIKIREMQPVKVEFNEANTSRWQGAMMVGDTFKPLPIGSTLDKKTGVFYWLPGPGFHGDYHFIFSNATGGFKVNVRIETK